MGKPKYIYMTDENFLKLSTEVNASALVNSLITNHYRKEEESKITDSEKEVKLAQDIEKKKIELELLQEEHSDILSNQEDIKLKELEAQKESERIKKLKEQWSDEVRNVPFDDRIKWKDWLRQHEEA